MTSTELREHHLFGPGPKRILSLEGGGVRGLISLAFLERLESVLQTRTGRLDLRLCEYFSLIGGTSTGAIIAAGLALGHSVGELIDLYLNISHQSFVRRRWAGFKWPGGKFIPKFDHRALREAILRHFGADTLGSDRLACGLAIVTKRLDTGSVWLFHNHPRGQFFGPPPQIGAHVANRGISIASLLRASTAAPPYFDPQLLEVTPGKEGLFVDGGVGPHNNPSLLLLMLATLRGYGFVWPMSENDLMLVSMGTGSSQPAPMWGRSYGGKSAAILAVDALLSSMHDSNWLAQTMLQWMSSSPTAWKVDAEVGDLQEDVLGGKPLLHYLRYDAPLDHEWLKGRLALDLPERELRDLREMDRTQSAACLLDIGRKAAEDQVRPQDFPAAFDI